MSSEPKLLSPRQFWSALGKSVGLNYIYESIRAGRIKHFKIGTRILIPASELSDWVERETALAA